MSKKIKPRRTKKKGGFNYKLGPDSEENKKPPTDRDWVLEINTSLIKGPQAIIDTGNLLIEAKDALPHGEWSAMFTEGKVGISHRTAEMYMRIAKNPVLSNPKYISFLPASLTTLYRLSDTDDLPEPVLEQAIADHRVNPNMDHDEAAKLVETVKSEGHYRWLELRTALNVLLKFANKWEDLKEVVKNVWTDAEDDEPTDQKEWVDWERLGSLSEWVTKLHEACQERQAQVVREEAEREKAELAEQELKRKARGRGERRRHKEDLADHMAQYE